MPQTAVEDTKNTTSHIRGLLFALLIVPVGVLLWVIIWQMGYIASLASLVIASGAVWLYKKGARTNSTKAATVPLLIIIIATVILAFFGGMAADAWAAYTTNLKGAEGFFSADFLGMFVDNITRSDLWSQYTGDIIMSFVFTAIGAGSIAYDLFKHPKTDKEQVQEAISS